MQLKHDCRSHGFATVGHRNDTAQPLTGGIQPTLTENSSAQSQYKFNCNKFEAQRTMTKFLYGYFRLCAFLLSDTSLALVEIICHASFTSPQLFISICQYNNLIILYMQFLPVCPASREYYQQLLLNYFIRDKYIVTYVYKA